MTEEAEGGARRSQGGPTPRAARPRPGGAAMWCGGPTPPFLREILRPENLSQKGYLTKSYRLCGRRTPREKSSPRAGIRQGNSLGRGNRHRHRVKLDIITITIIIISTIITVITAGHQGPAAAVAAEAIVQVPCQEASKHQGIDWGIPAEEENHQGTAAIEEGFDKGKASNKTLRGNHLRSQQL
ncbi:hypothetical protein QYE76_063392 [Lolium multiflorum]|uniref:Uncharacterized protein n=1 Tax=Lolium multiflorum TaxID=4521 RepID=A0AAD8W997_LOLMU|nr:hypothetical protein QYE76_063392 [Lolium multiflorum]